MVEEPLPPTPNEDEIKRFDYCGNVDLHAIDGNPNLNSVVAVAGEHGFRGIVVQPSRLEDLVAAINKPNFGDKEITAICAIDYPFGVSSMGVRNYMLHDAKEKGAHEVEVVIPYHWVLDKDWKRLYDDAQSLVAISNKLDLSIKYVIDQNASNIDDTVSARLCRIIASTRMPIVSTSLGFFDDSKISHADQVIKMRNLKSKAGCAVKVYVRNPSVEVISGFSRGGCDVFGVTWSVAANIVHSYENLLNNQE